MPLFVLAAPLTGVVAGSLFKPGTLMLLATPLVVWALPFLFAAYMRPVLSISFLTPLPPVWANDRFDQYFGFRPYLKEEYQAAAETLRRHGVRTIGIRSGFVTFEYPFWVAVKQAIPDARIVQLVGDEMESPQPGIDARVFLPDEPAGVVLPPGCYSVSLPHLTMILDRSPTRPRNP